MYDSITQKERKREVLTKFKGVDAASPVYAVDKARATAMRNFIAENGSNHKRPGWRQIARFTDSSGNPQAINGYFRFVVSLQEYRIVYAGTTFYIYDNLTDSYVKLATVMSNNGTPSNAFDPSRLIDRPVQMFVYGDRAYFVGCGDFLVFEVNDGKPELRRVYNDSVAYIPRTTTNIGPNETETDDDDNIIQYGDRKTDRDVNVLCKWRYNELIGSAQADASDLRTYTLDADDIESDDLEIKCYDYHPVYSEDEEPEITGYEKTDHTLVKGGVTTAWLSAAATERRAPVVGDDLGGKALEFDTTITSFGTLKSSILSSSSTRTLLRTANLRLYLDGGSSWDYVSFKVAITSSGTTTTTTIGHASRSSWLVRYTASWDADAITGLGTLAAGIGTVTYSDGVGILGLKVDGLPARTYELKEGNTVYGYIDFKAGKIALTKPIRPIQGEANISVKFAKTDEAAERILGCRFGTYFGTSGNANTLFLSGNADASNMDFWSEAEDFAYFPSGNCCTVGTPNTAIKGYLRLGDDSLAILKEESRHEPTLYVRSGVAASANTENEVTEGYYYTRGKFITQGAVSSWACAMLAGDPVFLSKSGVFGIVMTDNVAVEQRVARERSRFINPLLAKHRDLSKATAIVYDNRYYLAIDGAVYVADARYTHTARGDMPDTYNYEWWVWDNCPVRQWYEIDGALCFGTADGRLCVFDGEFTDRKQNDLGTHTVDPTNNRITFGTTYDTLAEGDLCRIDGNAYRVFIAAATVSSGKISFPETMLGYIHTGTVVYADTVGASGLSVDTKYIIDSIDAAELQFTIATEQGTAVTPASGGFRLLCHIGGEILKVHLEDGYLQVKNERTDELYTLAVYNSTAWSTKLYKYYRNNVVAEWYSPVLDMGANDYVKTLQRLTIATEQITNGRITFGWETKSASTLVDVDAKGLDVFDFGNLNFARFAFDTGFSSSFTRDVKADFNFILFRFISDNDCDCCVYSFTVTYKVNRRNKGVF